MILGIHARISSVSIMCEVHFTPLLHFCNLDFLILTYD